MRRSSVCSSEPAPSGPATQVNNERDDGPSGEPIEENVDALASTTVPARSRQREQRRDRLPSIAPRQQEQDSRRPAARRRTRQRQRAFADSRSRILERGVHVVTFEIWVVGEDLFDRAAGRELTDDRVHRHARIADTRYATHLVGVDGDPFERRGARIGARRPPADRRELNEMTANARQTTTEGAPRPTSGQGPRTPLPAAPLRADQRGGVRRPSRAICAGAGGE